MGHVAITTHPHPSNDSAGYKSQLEWHPATVRIKSWLVSIKHRPMAESLVVSNYHSGGLLVAGVIADLFRRAKVPAEQIR